MLYMENAKEHFESACGTFENDNTESLFYHRFANMIPNRIDVDTLVLALKIALQDEERIGKNTLPFISIIPQYVRQCASKEFAHEFRMKFNRDVLGLTQEDLPDALYGCIEVEKDVIDISKKDKYEVLAALYNASTPVGMGFMHYDPTPWDKDIAKLYFDEYGKPDEDGVSHFKWILGRPVNCHFYDGKVCVEGYNQDNEEGLGQRAISTVSDIGMKKVLGNR